MVNVCECCAFTKRSCDVGPPSTTLAQHYTTILLNISCLLGFPVFFVPLLYLLPGSSRDLIRPESDRKLTLIIRHSLTLHCFPAYTTHRRNVWSMLSQRRRRWINIGPTSGRCFVMLGSRRGLFFSALIYLVLHITSIPGREAWCSGSSCLVGQAKIKDLDPTLAFQFQRNNMFFPRSLVKIQYCGEPPWPRGSELGLEPLGFEYCVRMAVLSHSSHHLQEVLLAQFRLCAQWWPKTLFISLPLYVNWCWRNFLD